MQHHLVLSHRACGGCFMDLYSSCVLAFDKHVFVSWRAPHSTSPCKDTTLSKFHSHLSALVLRACGSATWSVRTSRIKSLHVHSQRDIFPPTFRIVTVQHYSLGYRTVCCWQGVHFFMFVSVEPASSMHTHTSQTFNFAHTTAKVARRATSEPRKVCIASLRVVVCRVCCCFLAAFLSFGPSVPWQATVLSRNTWNVHDIGHNGTSK